MKFLIGSYNRTFEVRSSKVLEKVLLLCLAQLSPKAKSSETHASFDAIMGIKVGDSVTITNHLGEVVKIKRIQ